MYTRAHTLAFSVFLYLLLHFSSSRWSVPQIFDIFRSKMCNINSTRYKSSQTGNLHAIRFAYAYFYEHQQHIMSSTRKKWRNKFLILFVLVLKGNCNNYHNTSISFLNVINEFLIACSRYFHTFFWLTFFNNITI